MTQVDSDDGGKVTYRRRELRGSRVRCLMLTSLPRPQIAAWLTDLIRPHAVVDAKIDAWKPCGLLEPDEVRLDDDSTFLDATARAAVAGWWLAAPRGANTPNWDIVSTCTTNGRRGLLLVEAKAHAAELSAIGKSGKNAANDASIRAAIAEANAGLNIACTGWTLDADRHYQLCNRFAWCWKLAQLGVPVILVYLGFLDAEEMADQGPPFRTAEEWDQLLRQHAAGIIPEEAWSRALNVGETPIRALIRSTRIQVEVGRRN